ncbi:MAG: hypothetical protein IKG70_00335 [Lachnospiraceae bacterium]|nr:hypothetical protein [Lachnospiraceae bacterium]
MAIRYIADMHFGYESIIAFDNRPFDTAEDMTEAMIRNWNGTVAPDDLTYILGDFASAPPDECCSILERLSGKKVLITGNHDAPDAVDAMRGLLEDVTGYCEITDGSERVVLCHYPILMFNSHQMSWCHLYGHVHSSYEWNLAEHTKHMIKKLYAREDVCRMANAGAMMTYMNYTPRTLEELKAYL